MKKIITAILATVFMAGMAMGTAHATNDQTSAKKLTKQPITTLIKRSCRGCPQKSTPILGNDALTPEQFEALFKN
jgi:hypothetical protein